MSNCRYPHDIVFACFLRNNVRLRNNVCIFLLIKIMLKNDFGFRGKSFGGSVKDRFFSMSYNDWRNMFININKKNCLLIFFEMFLKHVKMGWQFQGTLKLSVYLIHFKIFFSGTRSTSNKLPKYHELLPTSFPYFRFSYFC